MENQEHEPRRIVLILGNGFDLDLGLKTSYKDFWESVFCPKDYPAPLIRHLNKRWEGDLNAVRWYDLENELSAYAIYGDKTDVISDAERDYLNKNTDCELTNAYNYLGVPAIFSSLQEKGIIEIRGLAKRAVVPYREELMHSVVWRDREALKLIKERLCNYLSFISRKAAINSNSIALNVLFIGNYAREVGVALSIYTFNFTRLAEGYGNDVHYVHGNCKNGRIIIGTRDSSELDKNYDFLQKSFDPHFNPPALVSALSIASDVIIFGHSIGENDSQYFKAFFKQQVDSVYNRNKSITIFTRDDDSEMDIKRSLQKMTDYKLSTLYSQNNVEIIKTSKISEEADKLRKFFSNHVYNEARLSVILSQILEGQK